MRKSHLYLSCLFLLITPLILLSKDSKQEVLKKQEPLTREKNLVVFVDFGNGYMDLDNTQNPNIFESEFMFQKEQPEVRYELVGNEGRLNISFAGKNKKDEEGENVHNITSLKKIYDNELYLNLSREVPLDLDFELGVVKGQMNLGGLKIRNLHVEAGVSTADLIFNESNPVIMQHCNIEGGVGKLTVDKIGNANIRDFNFEGGLGSYTLDFSGTYQSDLDARINLGMGQIKLYLPKYLGVRIEVEKSFLSSFSVDEVYKKGDVYFNDNWEKTPSKLNLYIESGVGKVEVVWVDK
ncbi:MAG: LiaF domain-containing protein [Calditrichia bacterium]